MVLFILNAGCELQWAEFSRYIGYHIAKLPIVRRLVFPGERKMYGSCKLRFIKGLDSRTCDSSAVPSTTYKYFNFKICSGHIYLHVVICSVGHVRVATSNDQDAFDFARMRHSVSPRLDQFRFSAHGPVSISHLQA